MEKLIQVMHWTQKATEKINMTPVTKVRNLTKIPITPQIKGKLSVKRTLTWKSLARKIKKRIILFMLRINMDKSLKKKTRKMKKVMKRSRIGRFNSKPKDRLPRNRRRILKSSTKCRLKRIQ